MKFEFLRQNAELFILMIVMSILGGLSQYIRKIQQKKATFSIAELIGEAVISASAGITAGMIVIDHVSIPVTLVVTSVAAHMGTRFIYALESIYVRKIQSAIDGEVK